MPRPDDTDHTRGDLDAVALPPRLPQTLQQFDRAITLLGKRQTLELKPRVQQELIELLGEYPSQSTAAAWKRLLKPTRNEYDD